MSVDESGTPLSTELWLALLLDAPVTEEFVMSGKPLLLLGLVAVLPYSGSAVGRKCSLLPALVEWLLLLLPLAITLK